VAEGMQLRANLLWQKVNQFIIPSLRIGLSGSMINPITTRLTKAEPNTNRFIRRLHTNRFKHPEFGLSRLHLGRVASIHP